MESISNGISYLVNTYRNSKRSGKIAIGCSALFIICLCISVPIGMFSNLPDEPTKEVTTQNDLTAIYSTAQAEAWNMITQTAMAFTPEPTATLVPTVTLMPTFTLMVLPTATLEQAVALPKVAPCMPTNTKREEGMVIGIVDGDTIDVQIDNQTYRVRYIGIDTPENGDTGYWQATGENQNLVYAKQIILVKDVSETDRYDRLLRYIFIGDTFVNYELVRKGYAQASTYQPDVACSSYFSQTQNQAQSEQVGLWAPVPTVAVSSGGGSSGGSGGSTGGNCHPSYPDVCIPPPPPDLNCPDVKPLKNFRVLPPDPHNFDGDSDGIGCES